MVRETGGGASTPPPPHKGCNSSSCCSPAKLWRTIQTLIKENDKRGLVAFFKEDPRREHIIRVALTSRISNDATMFPPSQQHKLVHIKDTDRKKSLLYLGKSCTDLNSLQLALISSSESTVLCLLSLLKSSHATPQDLKVFVNHIYGQGNSSLHLAVFLKRYEVAKVLIELGCKIDHLNAKHKSALDCCYYANDQMIALFAPPPPLPKQVQEPIVIAAVAAAIIPPPLPVTRVNPTPPAEMTMQQLIAIVMKHVNKVHFNLIIQQIREQQQQQQRYHQQQALFDASYVISLQLKKPPDIPLFAC